MVDILSFFNSRDIADYLRQTAFTLSPVQAAYIIHESTKYGVSQKQTAWEDLIKSYPDELVKARRRGLPDMPLGEFLKRYIALQNEFIRECKTGEGIFSYEYFSPEDGYWIGNNGFEKDFQSCLQAAKDDLKDDEYEKIRIEKRYFGKRWTEITMDLLPDGEVWNINESAFLSGENHAIFGAFGWFWIDIPTPFKRGDIVKLITEPYHERPEEWEGVIVLTDMANWNSKKLKENGYLNGKSKRDHVVFARRNKHIWRLKEGGDLTDMNIFGYGICEDGTVFHDVWFPYLNAEYYRGEFNGKMGIFKALSSYEKGEIDAELLINACNIRYLREVLKNASEYLSCYTDEGLKLAGLKKEQEER